MALSCEHRDAFISIFIFSSVTISEHTMLATVFAVRDFIPVPSISGNADKNEGPECRPRPLGPEPS